MDITIKDISAEDLNKLVKQFNDLKNHDEKCRFFHSAENHPHLSRIYRAAHFPKPEEQTKPE